MLRVDNVKFRYKGMTEPLKFNLAVNAGQIFAVMGESGSGKSTLLDLVAGFQLPQSGSISWNSNEFHTLPPEKRPVTILFQYHNLFEHLSVEQNIAIGIDPTGTMNDQVRSQIGTVLENVGLHGFEKRIAATLSGGQQQRVALARALLRHHPVLLLDEPCAGLDADTRRDILKLIKTIATDQNRAVIIATHEPDDVSAVEAELYKVQTSS